MLHFIDSIKKQRIGNGNSNVVEFTIYMPIYVNLYIDKITKI